MMFNMLASPLFISLFLLIFGGLTAIYHVFPFAKTWGENYQAWLKLPLRYPLITLALHLLLSISIGICGFVFFKVIGLLGLPLSLYGGRVLLRASYQQKLKAYQRFLPELLELLALCMQAGLSLPFAMQRLLPSLNKRAPEWGVAINQVLSEIQLGIPVEKAFANLCEELPLPGLQRLSNMIGHAQAYGTQLTPLFKQMAQDMREDQLHEIEVRVQKLPVYLSVILVLFFLPALLLVTLAPLLIRLVESLSMAFS